ADRHELDLLELLLETAPEDFETLVRLGELYTRTGRHEDGLRADRRLVELAPANPIVRYNLACSLALLRKAEDACAALREAVRLGYRDLEHLLEDSDLESLHGHPLFADVVRVLERRRREGN